MATLGTMRARIARELQVDATNFSADIDAAVFSAISFYDDQDFWFLEAAPSLFVMTLTSQVALSTVLPDRSEIMSIIVHLGSRRMNMRYRTYQELLDLDIDDNYAGDPVFWSIHHDNLIIEPRLRQTRTIEIVHTLRRSMSASASASSVWTNEAEEVIRLHAEADIMENRLKDYLGADRAKARLRAVLESLNEKTVARKSQQRVRPRM